MNDNGIVNMMDVPTLFGMFAMSNRSNMLNMFNVLCVLAGFGCLNVQSV